MDKYFNNQDGYISLTGRSGYLDWLEVEGDFGGDGMHRCYSLLRSRGMDEFGANVLCRLTVLFERKDIDIEKLLCDSTYFIDIMKKQNLQYYYPDYKQKLLDLWNVLGDSKKYICKLWLESIK